MALSKTEGMRLHSRKYKHKFNTVKTIWISEKKGWFINWRNESLNDCKNQKICRLHFTPTKGKTAALEYLAIMILIFTLHARCYFSSPGLLFSCRMWKSNVLIEGQFFSFSSNNKHINQSLGLCRTDPSPTTISTTTADRLIIRVSQHQTLFGKQDPSPKPAVVLSQLFCEEVKVSLSIPTLSEEVHPKPFFLESMMRTRSSSLEDSLFFPHLEPPVKDSFSHISATKLCRCRCKEFGCEHFAFSRHLLVKHPAYRGVHTLHL